MPATTKLYELPRMEAPPLSFSVIRKEGWLATGAVIENLNAAPPFNEAKVGTPAPFGLYVGIAKSDDNPMALDGTESRTVTVQEIRSLVRTYVVPALV